jgi:hypothetical protein
MEMANHDLNDVALRSPGSTVGSVSADSELRFMNFSLFGIHRPGFLPRDFVRLVRRRGHCSPEDAAGERDL